MRDDQRHTQLQKRRRRDGAGDDVVGNRGNAHAENQAHDHRQQQRQKEAFRADVQHEFSKVGCGARQRQHADDHAHDRTRDADRQRLLRAVDKARAHDAERFASAADERVHCDQRSDGQDDRPDAVAEERRGRDAEYNPERGAENERAESGRNADTENQHRRERESDDARIHRRESIEQHEHEHGERQHEEPALPHRLPWIRTLIFR